MTETIEVLPVTIEGTLPSADGMNVLVKTKSGDAETVLAFSLDQAFSVISGVASAAEKCRELQGLGESTAYTMNVTEWGLGLSDSRQLVVSFTVLGGTKLSFQVGSSEIPAMREAFQAMERALAEVG